VSPNPTPRRPVAFRLYRGVLVACAVLLLGMAASHVPAAPVATVVLVTLLMVGFTVIASAFKDGVESGTELVMTLPLLLLAGPFWTSVARILAVVARGVADTVNPRAGGPRPWARDVHDAALPVLSTYAAGALYGMLRGSFGTVEGPTNWWIPALTGCVLFAVESFGVALFVGLSRGPRVVRAWDRLFRANLLHHLSSLAFGIVAAVLGSGFGLAGLVLVALPMFMSRLDFARLGEFRIGLRTFVRAFIEPLERVDVYTRHHSMRVAEYSVRLARGMGRPEHEVDEIEYAAIVHDIGKIGPEQQYILQKPGALTQEEQRTLRAHPATGAEMVKSMPGMHKVSELVLAHHERPDGLGYPHGLESEDVPLGARIINVADAFDAMTSDRPYRRALPVDAALRELERGAGTQFDADVVAVMLRLHERGAFPLMPSLSSEDLQLMRLRTRVGGV
jgi:putative nucleotidyltransferase with HDIG domain